MTAAALTGVRPVRGQSAPTARTRSHLADLLALAARGNHLAFMRFYDETAATTYALELRRWEDPELAELLTHARYVRAWDRAADHPGSGLSPLAWLLSLDLGGPDDR